MECVPSKCDTCSCELEVWKRKLPRSYLITLGTIKKIKIQVKLCPSCRVAFYPDLYDKGLISLHNKLMVSFDFILDLINILRTGGAMIETIQNRIRLLGGASGIGIREVETDISSINIKLEKFAIAVANIFVRVPDLNDVMCYICGACPKIVASGKGINTV